MSIEMTSFFEQIPIFIQQDILSSVENPLKYTRVSRTFRDSVVRQAACRQIELLQGYPPACTALSIFHIVLLIRVDEATVSHIVKRIVSWIRCWQKHLLVGADSSFLLILQPALFAEAINANVQLPNYRVADMRHAQALFKSLSCYSRSCAKFSLYVEGWAENMMPSAVVRRIVEWAEENKFRIRKELTGVLIQEELTEEKLLVHVERRGVSSREIILKGDFVRRIEELSVSGFHPSQILDKFNVSVLSTFSFPGTSIWKDVIIVPSVKCQVLSDFSFRKTLFP